MPMNQQHPQSPSDSCAEDEINLLELLLVIVRRRNLIIKICCTAVALSVCYSLTLSNHYTAVSRFFPPPKESAGGAFAAMLAQSGGLSGLAGGGFGGTTDLYLAILNSRTVADNVIKRLDLQKEFKTKNIDDTRKRLQGVVKAKGSKDGIVTVSVTGKDPVKAAQLVNVMVDEMIQRSVKLYLSKAGVERYFLEKRLEVVKKDLKNAENDLKAFQDKYKTIKADAQASVAIESIARLKAEIVSKEVHLATLRNSMTDESSDVKALQAGISRMKGQLGAMSGSGGSDNIIPATGNLPALGVEYYRKLRELKIQETIFEQLSKQFEVSKINEAKDSSTVQILDEAVPPVRKSGPKRSFIVIISTFAAFMLSVVVVFVQEYVSKLSPEDAGLINEIKQSLPRIKRFS
jgi:uncharacterized protein involved in exopolysaccharide biosynthesis